MDQRDQHQPFSPARAQLRTLAGAVAGSPVRRFAKRFAETVLTAVPIVRLALRARRGRVLVLAYHNVIPDGCDPAGDRSLHLPQVTFASQLDALSLSHDVIPLSAIDEAPREARARVVITFDDAYRGALTAGIAELKKRGLPATIFVCPGLFGTTTWWDQLAGAAGGAVPAAMREQALRDHRGRADVVLSVFGSGVTSLPPWAQTATADEVLAAATMPGITLGAHSWSHANLTALEPEDLRAELERPFAWLRGLGPRATPWLAYPYGLTSPAVARAAAAAGYAGAFRIEGGWMPVHPWTPASRYDLPRLSVPSGLSLAGFRLRAAGLL